MILEGGNLVLKQMFKYWNIPNAGYSSFQPTLDVNGNCRSSVNAATKNMFNTGSNFVTFAVEQACAFLRLVRSTLFGEPLLFTEPG